MKRIGIVAVLLLASIPIFLSAYTSPGRPTGFVNDFANIISPAQRSELENILFNLEKQTGNEISVVTIPSLEDETIESYAVKLFEDWKIGKEGKDNGILLLVALNDRKMRIEVGYGLEPYITDAQASSIIRNILTPNFKKGEYYNGIKEAINIIIKILEGDANAVPKENGGSIDIGNLAFFVIFILMWLASILGRSKSWWLGGALGGVAGIVIGFIYGFIFTGIIFVIVLAILGFIFDYIVSKIYHTSVDRGGHPPWWIGGGGMGGRGGGFGGFGGGSSGGGGGSGSW